MDLSLVDFSPTPNAGDASDAYAETIKMAREAERLGYTRFWLAEHHGSNALSGTAPEVLLGHLAAKTDYIRLGSGAILLNHYSPFKIAELFGTIDGLAPGRVDMGIGSATGSDNVEQALSPNGNPQDTDSTYKNKIKSVVRYLYDDFQDSNRFSDLEVPGSNSSAPMPWVLGSSPSSAIIAGELGLPYCFAVFINPEQTPAAFGAYREHFQSSQLTASIDEPTGIIAVNAICAETGKKAANLRAVNEVAFQRLRDGAKNIIPTVGEAIDNLDNNPKPTPEILNRGEWPQTISGNPKVVTNLLKQLANRINVGEVMIQRPLINFDDALRSQRLLAEAIGLSSQ